MAMPPACRYPDASACGKCASPLKTVFNDIWSILDGKVDMYNLDQDIFGPGIEIEKKRKSPTIAYERITVPIADDRNNGYIRNKKEEGIDVGIETVLRDTARYCISDGTNQIGSFSIDTNDLHLDTPLGDFYINEALALTTLGGTINKIPKFTSASAIGDSSLTDDGTKLINSYTKFYLGGTTAFDAVVIGDISGFQLKNGNESSFLPLTTESLFTKIGITTYAGLGVTGLELNNTDITWGFVSSTKNTGIKRTSDANLKVTDGSSGYGSLDAGTLKESGTALSSLYQGLNAKLTAISGMTWAADKLIYTTGASAITTSDLTSFARTLLDDVDAATVRGTLGLGDIATENKDDYAKLSDNESIIGDWDFNGKYMFTNATSLHLPTSDPTITTMEKYYIWIDDNTDPFGCVKVRSGSAVHKLWDDTNLDPTDYLTTADAGITYQPLNSKLTAISGMTWAADKLLYSTGASAIATSDLSAFARTYLDDADAATTRATLGLTIGTHVQAYDVELAAIAGLTSAADKGIQFTGSGTAATYDLTAAGKALLDDVDASAQRTTLGLAIGTNVQAYDATLQSLSSLGTTANKMLYTTGVDTWAEADITSGGRALVNLASAADKVPYFTGSGTASTNDFKTIARAIGGLSTPAANGVIVAGSDGSVTTFDAKSGASTILNLTAAADKIPYYTGASSSALADFPSAMRTFLTTPSSANFAALVNDDAFSLSDAELGAIAGLTSAADRLPYFTGSGTAALATYTAAARTFSALAAAQGEIVYSSGTDTWARLSAPTASANTPGQVLTHPGGSSAANPAWKTYVRKAKTGDQNVANSTDLTSTSNNDTDLKVNLTSGKSYGFSFRMRVSILSTDDYKLRIFSPGSSTFHLNSLWFPHGTGAPSLAKSTTDPYDLTIDLGVSQEVFIEIIGYITTSSGGSFGIRHAKRATGAQTPIVRGGSQLEVWEVN